MYEIIITDSTGSVTLPPLEVPLTEGTVEGATDVQTLDFNVYTSFMALKRSWGHTWAFMTADDFEVLKGFYQRQFSLYQYPRITISELGVTDLTVRMTLGPRNVIDQCGIVDSVQVGFRETRQLGS